MNRLLLVGFLLVLAGAVVPFLMVVGWLPSPLWLSLVVFACQVVGMFLGLIGAATMVRLRRRANDPEV